jgi:hypothetical protein
MARDDTRETGREVEVLSEGVVPTDTMAGHENMWSIDARA